MENGPVKPTRILIAEDSPDNRLLLRVFLKESPYQLTFEEDGQAALDRFANSDFDLVLLDVQMPVMDGLTAARAMRAMEQQRSTPSIPIIAMTAHASQQDIERSTEAGCSAHLSKPLSKLNLLQAIEKYKRRPIAEEIPKLAAVEPIGIELLPSYEDFGCQALRSASDCAVAGSEQPLDGAVLRKFMEDWPDDEFADLVELLVAIAPLKLSDMRRALQESSATDLFKAAHTLSGCCNFGDSPFFELCVQLEEAGRLGDMDRAAKLIAPADREWCRLSEALEPYRKPKPAPPGPLALM